MLLSKVQKMRLVVVVALAFFAQAWALRGSARKAINLTGAELKQPPTFQGYYYGHKTGRGIWKWSNSLDAYQKHFTSFMGKPVSLAEIGVQSGGSIEMWHTVLGAQCHVYGIDINQACTQFTDATTTITIGDQADNKMWDGFYTNTLQGKNLDILIDDGGHEPQQMLVTLNRAFPHMNPGGFIAIEDIHGRHYTQSFFYPSATSISSWAAKGEVEWISVAPFMLMVKKAGGAATPVPPISATVNDFPQLWPALDQHPGKFIALENAGWGSFLSEATMKGIFDKLAPMHDSSMVDTPAGCATTAAVVCTNTIRNSNSQAKMLSVTIYPTRAIVEVASKPPVIQAVRRGDKFLAYGL